MEMKILDALKRIEKSETVKILMAVESGSRAWGVPRRIAIMMCVLFIKGRWRNTCGLKRRGM